MRIPLEPGMHCEVLILMKITLVLNFLYNLFAGSLDQELKRPPFIYFSEWIPCVLCLSF